MQIPLDDPRWETFVRGRSDATPFHDPAWAMLLAECYGFPGLVLAEVHESGSVLSGIPLLAPPHLPRRPRRFVSLPFTDSLRPLVRPGDIGELAAAVDAFRAGRGIARIDLRGTMPGSRPAPVAAVMHVLSLPADPDEAVRGFAGVRRRNVRAAERRGLTLRRAETERDLTESFFRLHLETRRRLGVPVQPKRFFRLLWRRIVEPGRGYVLIVERARIPIAAAVFLTGRTTVVYKYGASTVDGRQDRPNDLLFSRAISDACAAGYASFDFGRTDLDNTGLRSFKSSFGALEEPLVYSTIGAGADAVAATPRLVRTVIRRSPTWVARIAGELLYRFAA